MTITNANGTEERGRNRRAVYNCPICNVSYGYIKDTINMDEVDECIACHYSAEAREFIPEIVGLDQSCAIFCTVEYKKRRNKN